MDDKEKELHLHVLHGLMDAIGHASITPFMSHEPKDGVVVTKEVHKEIPVKGIMAESEEPMDEEKSPLEGVLDAHDAMDEMPSEDEEDSKWKPRWMKK